MRRSEHSFTLDVSSIVAAAAGTMLGIALGYVAGGAVGRVNTRRIKGVVQRLSGEQKPPTRWTHDAAERLEAQVLDALSQDVVLARRPIRVAVLGMGLVELTGTVLHMSEIGLASDIVQQVPGVDTVLNHLVTGPTDRTVSPVGGPQTPRAARG